MPTPEFCANVRLPDPPSMFKPFGETVHVPAPMFSIWINHPSAQAVPGKLSVVALAFDKVIRFPKYVLPHVNVVVVVKAFGLATASNTAAAVELVLLTRKLYGAPLPYPPPPLAPKGPLTLPAESME